MTDTEYKTNTTNTNFSSLKREKEELLKKLREEELRDELVYCRNNHVMFMARAKTMNPMKKDFYLITGTMHYLQQFESGNVVYFMDEFGVNYFLFSYRENDYFAPSKDELLNSPDKKFSIIGFELPMSKKSIVVLSTSAHYEKVKPLVLKNREERRRFEEDYLKKLEEQEIEQINKKQQNKLQQKDNIEVESLKKKIQQLQNQLNKKNNEK